MVVVFTGLSTSHRDAHLKGFISASEGATGLTARSDDSVARTGETRVASFAYPGGSATPLVSPQVKVELHTIGGVSPHATVKLGSILSEHWEHIEGAPLAGDFDELSPLSVSVVAPCRTLVEKLVILHEAHTRDGGAAAARKTATVRHYYDVWCLLGDPAVLADLEVQDVCVLARDVVTYSQVADYESDERPLKGFATSPAFVVAPTRSVRDAYDLTMRRLVWAGAPAPSLDDCRDRVLELGAQL